MNNNWALPRGRLIALWVIVSAVFAVSLAIIVSPAETQILGLPRFAVLKNLAQAAAALLTCGLCLAAARAIPVRKERRAWQLFALAYLVVGIVSVLVGYRDVTAGTLRTFPSPYDAVYLAFYPLALFASIQLMQTVRTGTDRRAMILDSALFAFGVSAIMWAILVRPSALVAHGQLEALATFAYAFGDLLLMFILSTVFFVERLVTGRVPKYLLFMSLAAQVTGDIAFAYVNISSGGTVDTGAVHGIWAFVYIFGGTAALWRLHEIMTRGYIDYALAEPSRSPGWHRYRERILPVIPYVLFPVAVAIVAIHIAGQSNMMSRTAILGTVTGLLILTGVMVRQFLTLRHNVRLRHEIEDLLADLEIRVADRTKELTARTELAMQLSLASEAREILTIGIEQAVAITHARAGVAWVQYNGVLDLVTTQRFLGEMQERLEAYIRSEDLEQILMIGEPLVLTRESFPSVHEWLAKHGFHRRSIILIPLHARRSIIGAMALVYLESETPGESEMDLLRSMGAQLGVAAESAHQYAIAREQAERDSLTGMLNHRSLHARLEAECKRSQRSGESFSVIMMDVDGFKRFNDTYGHQTGDRVLVYIARLLNKTLRESDVVGRYGGDEFVAILPSTSGSGAVSLCESIQAELLARPFMIDDLSKIQLRISFGVATYPADAPTATDLIARADAALYASKRRGGNYITAELVPGPDEAPAAGHGALQVLEAPVAAAEATTMRDDGAPGTVVAPALLIARELSLPPESQQALRLAGMLLEMAVDSRAAPPGEPTLDGPGARHRPLQREVMNEVLALDLPRLQEVASATVSHGERWDGSGRPHGLAGETIPLLSRILAVAEAWSLLTSPPPGRALSEADALAELYRGRGMLFDPQIVDAFVAAHSDAESPQHPA